MYLADEYKGKSDNELAALSVKNSDFFAYLMDRYEKPLGRYLSKIGGFYHDEKEQLLQDIFIKIYQNLNDFDGRLKFSSWAYRIAHNAAIDHLRRARVRGEVSNIGPEDEDLFESIPTDLDIAKETDRSYLSKHIRTVLDAMDPKYRSVLILKFFEEKEYSEISDILKKPIGTVATLLNRAKKQFRERAERLGIDISSM